MKTIKTLSLLLILSIGISSCSILNSTQRKMLNIEKGMTKNEITRLLGVPDYRNFDSEIEEWIYVKIDMDLIVGFYNGVVESLNSLPPNTYRNRSIYPDNSYNTTYPSTYPNYPQPGMMNRAISEREFQDFYNSVNQQTFKDDKMDALRRGTYNRAFTCSQCVRMMNLFTFDDDKLLVFNTMSSNIVDWENQQLILDNFKFISSREKARQTIDSILRR